VGGREGLIQKGDHRKNIFKTSVRLGLEGSVILQKAFRLTQKREGRGEKQKSSLLSGNRDQATQGAIGVVVDEGPCGVGQKVPVKTWGEGTAAFSPHSEGEGQLGGG